MTRGNQRTTNSPAPGLLRIPRPEVDQLLDTATQRRICLVTACAGWGKTTAIQSWAADRPAAWLTTAPDDHLFESWTEALRPHVPAPPPPATSDPRTAALSLCTWLAKAREELFLVVDELHELRAADMPAEVLARLCGHAPESVHLVLLSRGGTPFSLERLRGRGLVAEIDAAPLAFRPAEVNALLRHALDEEAPSLARQVHEQSGGWPAATCRAVEALQAAAPEHRLDALHSAAVRFRAYIAEEVLGHEPEPEYRALRRLAVLGEAHTDDPDQIAERGVLVNLARRGLLRPTEDAPGHWRLVPPLADHLRAPGTIPTEESLRLHRRAGAEHLRAHRFPDALRQLVAGQDHQACAALLTEHGGELVDSGEVELVLRAAAQLPADLDEPRLRWVCGHARQVRGHWADAERCYEETSSPLPPALAWRKALLALARGDFGEALAFCDAAGLDGEDTEDEVRVLSLATQCAVLVGDQDRFRTDAHRAMAAARRCGSPTAQAAGMTARAMLATVTGDRRESASSYLSALRWAEACNDRRRTAQLRTMRAHHLIDLGHPLKAVPQVESALRFCQRFHDPFLRALALSTRGDARVRLGELDLALTDYDEACELFQRLGSRFLSWPLRGCGEVYRLRSQVERARSAYEEALTLAETRHDVLALGSALIGLALTRAADNGAAALAHAERALSLSEGALQVRALLARGWVRLETGQRHAAHEDATEAADRARAGGTEPSLAEALTLAVVSAEHPADHDSAIAEAIEIWREHGYRIEEAQARLLLARLRGSNTDDDALATKALRSLGVPPTQHTAAGLLRVLCRWEPSLSLRALGSFQVWRGDQQVPATAWQSRKARDLLKILVARRRPVRREQLMELLWPEVDPARAGNRLSVLLSTLRDVLQPRDALAGNTLLTSDSGMVGLDPRHVHIDVEEFLDKAERALIAHEEDRAEATDLLLVAEAGHTGEFLEDDPYQEWAAPMAEEVRSTHVAVLRALTQRLRARHDITRMTRYALRLLEHDRYDENVHFDLIRALLEADRYGEAHRRYRLYRDRMREIGVRPRDFPGIPPPRRPRESRLRKP